MYKNLRNCVMSLMDTIGWSLILKLGFWFLQYKCWLNCSPVEGLVDVRPGVVGLRGGPDLVGLVPVDLAVLADEVSELGDLVERVDVGHPVEVEVVRTNLLPQVATLKLSDGEMFSVNSNYGKTTFYYIYLFL